MVNDRHLTAQQTDALVNDFCPAGSVNPTPAFDEAVRNFLSFVLATTAIPSYDLTVTKYTYDEPVRFLIEVKNVLLSSLSGRTKINVLDNEYCQSKWGVHMECPQTMRASVETVTYGLFDSKEKCGRFKEAFQKCCANTVN